MNARWKKRSPIVCASVDDLLYMRYVWVGRHGVVAFALWRSFRTKTSKIVLDFTVNLSLVGCRVVSLYKRKTSLGCPTFYLY